MTSFILTNRNHHYYKLPCQEDTQTCFTGVLPVLSFGKSRSLSPAPAYPSPEKNLLLVYLYAILTGWSPIVLKT